MPKLIAVVGGKHSGKTTTIEHLIAGLSSQGYRVGTIKEMVFIQTLDTPQKETDRYRQAGAKIVAAVPRDETVIFVTKKLSVKEILPHMTDLDYIILEGFESELWLPKIVVAKTAEEVHGYFDGSIVAISGKIADSPIELMQLDKRNTPVINCLKEIKDLVEIVKTKALSQPD
jgi:molybdopterin-guanine dinucleotide biosynthesis adapter protein